MDAPTQAILSAFSIVLGVENGDRQTAEESLTALEVLEVYPVKLMNIFFDEQLCIELRQLAGITLKNYIASHWSESSCLSFKSPQTSDEVKPFIRSTILQLLSTPHRLLRTTAAHIITLIAQHDWPEMWPNLFNQMIELIQQSSLNTDSEVNKNTAHGVLRVLSEISSDLSDLDLPIIGPYIMPELLRIYSGKECYNQSTRRRAIITMDNLLNIAVMCHNEDILNTFVDRYIRPSLGTIVNDLTSEQLEISLKTELVQLLTTLCVENPKFFSNFLGYNISQMISIVLQLVVCCVKQYVELKIGPGNSITSDGHKIDEEYDSDGEVLDYDTFVYSILECLNSLISSKRRNVMIKYLDDICFEICQFVQLPEKTLETWTNNISEYIVDSEEFFAYSVRLVTMDLIKKIASNVPNGIQFINRSVNKMLALSEDLNNKGVPYWWKLLEASLYICGILASNSVNIFTVSTKNTYQIVKNTTTNSYLLEFDLFYTRYLKPSLGQNDYPFLQATALHCISYFYQANILNESQSQSFPSLLVNAMSSTQSSILRISAMHSLNVLQTFDDRKKMKLSTTTPSTSSTSMSLKCRSSSSSIVWRQNYIVPYLPNLISNLLECLSIFGESVLDIGLSRLYHLLTIDLYQFTQSIIGQIIPIMIGLFKHCIGVATTLSYYTKIIRLVYKVSNSSKESIELIENAFMPTLLGCLESQETSDCGSVEAALKVFCVLISPSEFGISSNLIQRVFPTVVHIAITNTDSIVISECCDVIRCYLAASPEQILDWHDDEGNNGVGYILHVTSRLLDPSNPVEWAIPAGKLAYAILLRFTAHQLRENTDLLLRGVIARLCTLFGGQQKLSSHLSYIDQQTGIYGARQSLLFVLILLFRLQTKLAIDFLSTIPDLTGKPILQEILSLWCNCQPYYFSNYEIQVSTMALANLILHTINNKDERVMQITIQEELNTSNDLSGKDDNVIQTRAKSSQQVKTLINIPIVVSMYKLLLNELNKKIEEDECDTNDSEFNGDDDDEANEQEAEEEEDNADDNEDNDDDDEEEEEDYEIDKGNKLKNGEQENMDKMHGESNQDFRGQRMKKREKKDSNNNLSSSRIEEDDGDDIDDEDDPTSSEDPIYSTDPIMDVNLKEYLCNFLTELSHQVYYNEFSRYHTSTELATLRQIGVLPQIQSE